MSELAIPAGWDEVTPAWMTAALASAFPGVEVSSVDVLLVDDGTNRRARLGLTYAGAPGPATVFLKAADPSHVQLNLATGGLFNEARLFSLDLELPVEHPAVHLALLDEPGLDFLLVMEDVTGRGGDPRDSTRPLSIDQARDGVQALARLHSAFWGHRLDARDQLAWVEPLVAWKGVMGAGITIGLQRVADTIPPQVSDLDGTQVEELWCDYISTMSDGAQTLLHGDAHVGNTYVLSDGTVGFLDWQVLRRGNHALDLGYFLQGAVTTEDRRAGEADLIDAYHHALRLPDDERPTRDEVWLRYRASVIHGLALWMATASSDTWQRPAVSRALAERYAAAYVDLDTPSAVDELARR
jgi:aminoglycoside phosphotransferase (APT) family kinase protein